jgi:hypothetical protein
MASDDPYPPREYWNTVREEYKTSAEHRRDQFESAAVYLVYFIVGVQSIAAIGFGLRYHPAVGMAFIVAAWLNVFVLFPTWVRRLDDARPVLADRLPLLLRHPLLYHMVVLRGVYFGGHKVMSDGE